MLIQHLIINVILKINYIVQNKRMFNVQTKNNDRVKVIDNTKKLGKLSVQTVWI